jgi:hypothetical protein
LTNPLNEVERIRALVSDITGAEFEKVSVKDHRPESSIRATWYIACLEITEAREIPYVNTVWRDDNEIRMESLAIGEVSDMIEYAYGEEAVYPLLEMDLRDFGKPEFREKFLIPYPVVKRRLGRYEKIVKDVAMKDGTKLEIRYEEGEGVVVFYLDAIVDAPKVDADAETEPIQMALSSLKRAYEQIARIS